jgi:hypothetical protein
VGSAFAELRKPSTVRKKKRPPSWGPLDALSAEARQEQDDFSSNRRPAPAFCLSMSLSEIRRPLVGSKPEGGLLRIML